MKTTICRAIAFAVLYMGTHCGATVYTFDTPVVTGATQAPGVWYTDRYAPAGFTSPDFFAGSDTLKQSISAADGETSRPPAYVSSFYNTQGRKYDLAPAAGSMSIDLYIPADWATTDRRMAGFWGTAFDSGNNISFYPIIEFTSDSSTPRFRGWNDTSWVDMGLPTGFAYNAWYTLEIDLAGSDFVYKVGNLMTSVNNLGSTNIGNVILQGHNTSAGVTYDIHWDNLSVSAVPEASVVLFGTLACCGTAVVYMRRQLLQRGNSAVTGEKVA